MIPLLGMAVAQAADLATGLMLGRDLAPGVSSAELNPFAAALLERPAAAILAKLALVAAGLLVLRLRPRPGLAVAAVGCVVGMAGFVANVAAQA